MLQVVAAACAGVLAVGGAVLLQPGDLGPVDVAAVEASILRPDAGSPAHRLPSPTPASGVRTPEAPWVPGRQGPTAVLSPRPTPSVTPSATPSPSRPDAPDPRRAPVRVADVDADAERDGDLTGARSRAVRDPERARERGAQDAGPAPSGAAGPADAAPSATPTAGAPGSPTADAPAAG